jgi:hypothetical protein
LIGFDWRLSDHFFMQVFSLIKQGGVSEKDIVVTANAGGGTPGAALGFNNF